MLKFLLLPFALPLSLILAMTAAFLAFLLIIIAALAHSCVAASQGLIAPYAPDMDQ